MVDGDVISAWQDESSTRTCPRCHHLTLHVQPAKGKIYCTHCEFSEEFPVMDEA